jgi:hypothetical protein
MRSTAAVGDRPLASRRATAPATWGAVPATQA